MLGISDIPEPLLATPQPKLSPPSAITPVSRTNLPIQQSPVFHLKRQISLEPLITTTAQRQIQHHRPSILSAPKPVIRSYPFGNAVVKPEISRKSVLWLETA